MAEQEEMKGGEVRQEKAAGEAEAVAVAVELTAPAGWTKKFMPSEGGTPRRNEIVFISPTGEEIKNKRQLQQYLKAHAGGPPSSEFDWRTGDTPRRSARIREKTKAVETPEDEKPKKRERKSSSMKEAREKDAEGDEASPMKEEGAVAEAKEDVTMQEVEVPADFQTQVGDEANEVIDEIPVDVETKVDDGANKVINEVPADVETKVDGDANEVKDKVPADVETKVDGDDANKVKDEVPADFETKVDGDANKVKDEVPADVETKVDGDAKEAIAEAVAAGESPNEKKDSVLESNGSADNKTEAVSENHKEVTPEVVPTAPVAEKHDGEFSTGNSKHKEDAEAAVMSEPPSTSCGEAQHLPKASPVNC
ncbi:methyl-CpG-binding domain-containing protein 11-like isoform X1 [Zingiber officinale]|uniref:methyl-CpG-binding domain-containing protein 11-like isoform X1 n=2 Tax=Zingiber officinale TaxID=94328 RepID=UPI001C4ABC87|nr:methyl-CpG-binding domain-containing protein 11-like isoform X1 [Zingiber officinale]